MMLFLYAIQLGDLLSPGPLALPHAKYEGLNHCARCHELFGGVSDERCLACHREIRRSLARPLSYHSRAKGPCRQCHPDHRGKEFQMVQLDERAFAHDRETTYPLEGKHAGVPCEKCHKSDRFPRYSGLRRDCAGCPPGRSSRSVGRAMRELSPGTGLEARPGLLGPRGLRP